MRGMSARGGSALLIVLGMVAFMVVSAVGFSVFMRNNRIPSSYLRRSTASRQLAKAALANAMADIDTAINENPYPGLGRLSVSGNNDNIWYGRVLCKREGGDLPDPSTTVSTLTLEGLAYLPPAIINDVRYFSRRTPTAKWSRLDYDAGRCAYCIVDVSDFFDLNSVRADRPRGSGDDTLISLAYLFESGTGREWGEVKPLKFQEVIDRATATYPLVSIADYNLVLRGFGGGLGDFPSPFCDAVEKDKGSVYGTSPLPDGDGRLDNWEYLKYAIQRFVTDVQPGRDKEEWFDESADRFGLLRNSGKRLDLSLKEDQPFPSIFEDDDPDKNDSSAGRICQTSTKFLERRIEQINQCEWMALYDYLDRDDIPLTVAAPTVDRSPMIVAVAVDPNSDLSVKIARDPANPNEGVIPDVDAATQITTYRKTITYYPELNGTLRLRVGLVYPFKYRKELYAGRRYEAQAIAKFYPLEKGAVWQTDDAKHGCRTGVNSTFGKFEKNPNGGGAFKDGVMTLASQWSETTLPDSFNGSNAVSGNNGRFHDIELKLDGFKGCNDELKANGFIARYHLKRRVKVDPRTGAEVALDEGIEIDGQTGWTLDETKGEGAEAGSLLALTDEKFMEATGRKFGDGDATYVWGLSLAVKLRDPECGNLLVDMAPAHITDDDMPPEGDIVRHLGNLGRPVLRFDGKANGDEPNAHFTVKKRTDVAGCAELQEAVALGNKKVDLFPRAYFTDDPRYNYAAENWYPENNLGDGKSLGEIWRDEKATCGKGDKDGDIFMSVSNQGYLQDPGELAFLPRVCGFDTQGEYGPIKNNADGKIPASAGTVANKSQMWRTYSCFGRKEGGKLHKDEVDNLCIFSPVRGYRVNPYTNDEIVKLAPFVNTPYDWWAAGSNRTDDVKASMVGADGKMDESGTARKYAFGPHGVETPVEHARISELASHISGVFRSGASATPRWYKRWGDSDEGNNLQWLDYGSGGRDLFGVDLGVPLHDIDLKYLCSYWRKCYANAQQLFLVFFRSEPVVIGGGAGDGKAPPQLGARGVAVVWRDPNAPDGESGSTSSARRPHAMRVLFYHQFE